MEKIVYVKGDPKDKVPFMGVMGTFADAHQILSSDIDRSYLFALMQESRIKESDMFVVFSGISAHPEIPGKYMSFKERLINDWWPEIGYGKITIIFSYTFFNSATSTLILMFLTEVLNRVEKWLSDQKVDYNVEDVVSIVWLATNEDDLDVGFHYKSIVEKSNFFVRKCYEDCSV